MHDRQSKTSSYPVPQIFTENTKKNLYLKLDLPAGIISSYFLRQLLLIYHLHTCNSPRFNLSVIILLILMLPSSPAKISFSNTELISETTFHYTEKTCIALC